MRTALLFTAILASVWIGADAQPAWSQFTPIFAYANGGMTITIDGANLDGPNFACIFKGVSHTQTASAVQTTAGGVALGTRLICNFPAWNDRAQQVQFQLNDGNAVVPGPAPANFEIRETWLSASTFTGTALGGTLITISGFGFNVAQKYHCEFKGSITAKGNAVTPASMKFIICPVPEYPFRAEPTAVSVYNAVDTLPLFKPGGQVTFTYTEVFQGLVPEGVQIGTVNGGKTLTIKGAGFDAISAPSYECRFTFNALGVVLRSAIVSAFDTNYIHCVTPALSGHMSAVPSLLELTHNTVPVPTLVANIQFTFQWAAVYTGISVTSGHASGGTTLVVYASGLSPNENYWCEFSRATRVLSSQPVKPISPQNFTCVTPRWTSTAGNVDVLVKTTQTQPDFTKNIQVLGPVPRFNFTEIFLGLSDVTGPSIGGTVLTVLGAGFDTSIGGYQLQLKSASGVTIVTNSSSFDSAGQLKMTIPSWPGPPAVADARLFHSGLPVFRPSLYNFTFTASVTILFSILDANGVPQSGANAVNLLKKAAQANNQELRDIGLITLQTFDAALFPVTVARFVGTCPGADAPYVNCSGHGVCYFGGEGSVDYQLGHCECDEGYGLGDCRPLPVIISVSTRDIRMPASTPITVRGCNFYNGTESHFNCKIPTKLDRSEVAEVKAVLVDSQTILCMPQSDNLRLCDMDYVDERGTDIPLEVGFDRFYPTTTSGRSFSCIGIPSKLEACAQQGQWEGEGGETTPPHPVANGNNIPPACGSHMFVTSTGRELMPLPTIRLAVFDSFGNIMNETLSVKAFMDDYGIPEAERSQLVGNVTGTIRGGTAVFNNLALLGARNFLQGYSLRFETERINKKLPMPFEPTDVDYGSQLRSEALRITVNAGVPVRLDLVGSPVVNFNAPPAQSSEVQVYGVAMFLRDANSEIVDAFRFVALLNEIKLLAVTARNTSTPDFTTRFSIRSPKVVWYKNLHAITFDSILVTNLQPGFYNLTIGIPKNLQPALMSLADPRYANVEVEPAVMQFNYDPFYVLPYQPFQLSKLDLSQEGLVVRNDVCGANQVFSDDGRCNCDRGYEFNATIRVCRPCAIGFYKTQSGSQPCDACPENAKTLTEGSIQRHQCKCNFGYYERLNATANDGSKECIKCDAALLCLGGGDITQSYLQEGYWRNSSSSPIAYRCDVEESCCGDELTEADTKKLEQLVENGTDVGVTLKSNDCQRARPAELLLFNSSLGERKDYSYQCGKAYRGALCGSCQISYGRNAGVCRSCSGGLGLISFLGVSVVLVLVVYIFLFLKAQVEESDTFPTLKVLFNYFQIVQVASVLHFKWPTQLYTLFDAIRALSASFNLNFFFAECALALDFYVQFMLTMLIPAIFLAIVCAPSILRFLVALLAFANQKAGFAPEAEERDITDTTIPPPSQIEHTRTKLLDQLGASVSVAAFLFFPTIALEVWKVFNCVPIVGPVIEGTEYVETTRQQFLRFALHLACNTEEHQAYKQLATFFAILYCVGMPAFVLLAVLINHEQLMDKNALVETGSAKKRFLFLVNGFKPKFWYWEVVYVIRKGAMISCIVLLEDTVQAEVATIIIFISLALHLMMMPYQSRAANTWEGVMLIVALVTFSSGRYYLFNDGNPSQTDYTGWEERLQVNFVEYFVLLINGLPTLLLTLYIAFVSFVDLILAGKRQDARSRAEKYHQKMAAMQGHTVSEPKNIRRTGYTPMDSKLLLLLIDALLAGKVIDQEDADLMDKMVYNHDPRLLAIYDVFKRTHRFRNFHRRLGMLLGKALRPVEADYMDDADFAALAGHAI